MVFLLLDTYQVYAHCQHRASAYRHHIFPGVCHGLRRLGLPSLFVSQLSFLYRYIFVLLEETMRMIRARNMRSYGERGKEIKIVVRIVGILFIRTVERAERIYFAMLSRGFQGDMPSLKRYRIKAADIIFTVLVFNFSLRLPLISGNRNAGAFIQGVFS